MPPRCYTRSDAMDEFRILTINPGSTSTKVALFANDRPLFEEVLRHSTEELALFQKVIDQYEFRRDVILSMLEAKGINLTRLSAVVGRGGLFRPMESGTYRVNEAMLKDAKSGEFGEHASNLGALLAYEIAEKLNIPAFVVDPVVVDEMDDVARISGMPEIMRKSRFHALNQKAVARRVAKELGLRYADANFIVVHLGGGISVGAHKKGRVVDVNDALDAEGPFSPERSGGVPVGDLARMCFSGKYSYGEIKKKITGRGGLVAYLGTNDGREVEQRIAAGDRYADLIYRAMAYQVAKEVGACAAVLCGEVDAVILTGGLAHSPLLTGWISERVSFIARVIISPGEDEMRALAEGALRVLQGEEEEKQYMNNSKEARPCICPANESPSSLLTMAAERQSLP